MIPKILLHNARSSCSVVLATMGRVFKQYLDGERIYTCTHCSAHLTFYSEIISKVCSGTGL